MPVKIFSGGQWRDINSVYVGGAWRKINSIYSGGAWRAVGGPATQPPAAATNFRTTSISWNFVDFAWDDVTNEAGYYLHRSTVSGFTPTDSTRYLTIGMDSTSVRDGDVAEATTYYYILESHNAAGKAYTGQVTATTAPKPINAPTDLVVSGAAAATDLSWIDRSDNETDFEIQRATGDALGPTTAYSVIDYKPAAAGTGATVTYRDATTGSGNFYWYRVRAINAKTTSDYTAEVGIDFTASTAPPTAPSSLTLEVLSSSAIRLRWTDNSADETGFKIYQSTDGTNFVNIANVGSNVTLYDATGLTAGTRYWYRVTAHNANGESSPTNIADATTTSGGGSAPAAPSGVEVVANLGGGLRVTWVDNSTNEDGFRVYRNAGGAGAELLATVGADVTAYDDTTATDVNISYCYAIAAYNGVGESARTAEVCSTGF